MMPSMAGSSSSAGSFFGNLFKKKDGGSGNGGKRVSQWLDACKGDCNTRIATGGSWRGGGDTRPLEADRGYDDVGFRLVRDE